jgi:hypothetical protein
MRLNIYLFFALFLCTGSYAMIDVEWNKQIINIIEKEELSPPIVARSLSLLYKSMLESYLETSQITDNEMYREYAVNGAAHKVVSELFPKYNIKINATINSFNEYRLFKYYNSIGGNRAQYILYKRKDDMKLLNSNKYVNKTGYGMWYGNPLLPEFGKLKPVGIKSVEKYLMPPPPKHSSYYFKKSYNETWFVGKKVSKKRTNDQTASAYFWEAGKGTCTPPGVWNLIAQKLVEEKHDLLERLYIFSTLNDALFDTAISVWYNKYIHNAWRPDMVFKNWEPLLKTPPFPEYGSGHSAFSGAGSEVLTSFFGDHAFSLTMKNMTRSYLTFYDAAYEAGRSRIYGGIHFEFSNIPFINMGMSIAREVIRELKR